MFRATHVACYFTGVKNTDIVSSGLDFVRLYEVYLNKNWAQHKYYNVYTFVTYRFLFRIFLCVSERVFSVLCWYVLQYNYNIKELATYTIMSLLILYRFR